VLSEDRKLITYRPSLRVIGQSVTGTILFQQILYWWEKSGRKPFFKFKEPCEHQAYSCGDSWCEELSFSKKEVTTALTKFAFRRTQDNKEEEHDKPVEFWMTPDRRTFYKVDESNLSRLLGGIYVSDQSSLSLSDQTELRQVTKGDLDIQENKQRLTEESLFSLFWNSYPRKVNKSRSAELFNALAPEQRQNAIDGISQFVKGKDLTYLVGSVERKNC
jgi:hypothetical protein